MLYELLMRPVRSSAVGPMATIEHRHGGEYLEAMPMRMSVGGPCMEDGEFAKVLEWRPVRMSAGGPGRNLLDHVRNHETRREQSSVNRTRRLSSK